MNKIKVEKKIKLCKRDLKGGGGGQIGEEIKHKIWPRKEKHHRENN